MLYRIVNIALLTFCISILLSSTARAVDVPVSGLVDDNSPGWIFRGMDEVDDPAYTGGSAHAGGGSAYCAYTFKGTGVEVIGMGGQTVDDNGRAHKLGRADISVDGKQVGTAKLQTASTTYQMSLIKVSGLSDVNHVLEITADDGWIVVDCIYVTGGDAVAGAPSTGPASGALQDGDYRLRPKLVVEKCLDVASVPVAGVQVEINHVDTDRPQVWHVSSLGGGRYEVSPVDAPKLALTLTPPNDQDGAPVAHLYNYVGDPTEQLTLTPTSDGFFRISPSSNNGVVLDVLKLQTVDGTACITYGWWGADNQQWKFERVNN